MAGESAQERRSIEAGTHVCCPGCNNTVALKQTCDKCHKLLPQAEGECPTCHRQLELFAFLQSLDAIDLARIVKEFSG